MRAILCLARTDTHTKIELGQTFTGIFSTMTPAYQRDNTSCQTNRNERLLLHAARAFSRNSAASRTMQGPAIADVR